MESLSPPLDLIAIVTIDGVMIAFMGSAAMTDDDMEGAFHTSIILTLDDNLEIPLKLLDMATRLLEPFVFRLLMSLVVSVGWKKATQLCFFLFLCKITCDGEVPITVFLGKPTASHEHGRLGW